MKALRISLWGIAVLVIALILLVAALRLGIGATDRKGVIGRWAGPPARFVSIDGVPIHVLEQGPKNAPVIVMLHGSIVNLHEWDDVAARLEPRFHVVRFDWAPYGLSGPDPKGLYSTPRAAQLMNGLMMKLSYDHFVLVSTSNGANVALEYNKEFPGHARAMAFSILPLERPSQTRKVDWRLVWLGKFHATFLPNWRSHMFWRLMLEDTTAPGFHPTDRMVDQIYDMNNLPGALERQAQYIKANVKLFKTSKVSDVAQTVHVPVLLQWCNFDTVISQDAQTSVKMFTNTHVTLIRYPSLGHFPMWENPDLFTRDLKTWIDGLPATQTSAPARH